MLWLSVLMVCLVFAVVGFALTEFASARAKVAAAADLSALAAVGRPGRQMAASRRPKSRRQMTLACAVAASTALRLTSRSTVALGASWRVSPGPLARRRH